MKQIKTINLSLSLINMKGLHARAAAKIVSISAELESKITLTHKSKSASSLSLIKLLTLDAPKGSTIKINIIGKDAKQSANRLKQLFESGFDELNE